MGHNFTNYCSCYCLITKRKIESKNTYVIAIWYRTDIIPINASLQNGHITDTYYEFIINSNHQEFIDLNSLSCEFKLNIQDEAGKPLTDAEPLEIIDGFGYFLIQKLQLFLNGTPCQNSTNFGIYNYMKACISMNKDSLSGVGQIMYFKYNDETCIEK